MDDSQLLTCQQALDTRKPLGAWDDAPAVPATTVTATNTTDFAMGVEIGANGATITAVKVDGVTIGPGSAARTTGRFRVRPGSTIAIVYSAGSPEWQWFYE